MVPVAAEDGTARRLETLAPTGKGSAEGANQHRPDTERGSTHDRAPENKANHSAVLPRHAHKQKQVGEQP
jgi:hypothetical protein